MGSEDSSGRGYLKYAGLGLEFAAAVAGFALVGYWIDRHYETGPWGLVIGAALGLIGGTYNLVRQSLAAFQRFEHHAEKKPDEDEQN